MELLTTIGKVIGFVLILIVGAYLRDWTYRNVRGWHSTYEDDIRRLEKRRRKERKEFRKRLRELDRKKVNK